MSTLESFNAFLRTIQPWLTSGLIGAIAGFALNRRVAKRREARMTLRSSVNQFSILGDSDFKDKLSVSFDGAHYKNLVLCECEVKNPSRRTIEQLTIVFEFDPAARFVGNSTFERTPVPCQSSQDRTTLPPHMVQHTLDALGCGATLRFRALVDGAPYFQVHVRAKDDPEVTRLDGVGRDQSMDTNTLVMLLVLQAATFLLVGALPVLPELPQALILIAAIPNIRRLTHAFSSVLSNRSGRREMNINIVGQTAHGAAVGVSLSDVEPPEGQ
jgi:hypothetical protein